MEKQELVNAGYKEYPITIFESDWACASFQKRVCDERGTKYYINVYLSKPGISFKPNAPTVKAQFSLSNMTVNIEVFNFTSLQDAEKMAETIWQAIGAEYYERKDE